jgi:hypothetical protein
MGKIREAFYHDFHCLPEPALFLEVRIKKMGAAKEKSLSL